MLKYLQIYLRFHVVEIRIKIEPFYIKVVKKMHYIAASHYMVNDNSILYLYLYIFSAVDIVDLLFFISI